MGDSFERELAGARHEEYVADLEADRGTEAQP